MKQYFSVVFGVVALAIEVLFYLSLMELPPFCKGSSDIVWGLPFFGLMVPALAITGLSMALRAKSEPKEDHRLVIVGIVTNALSLTIPILLLLFCVLRVVVFR